MKNISNAIAQLNCDIKKAASNSSSKIKDIILVAVSKTCSEEAILTAIKAGQQHFGENYAQELADKANKLHDQKIIWHFIGKIQSNKTRLIAKHASWIHTITKVQQARRLNDQRMANLPPLQVLIEVNISNENNKGGLHSFAEILQLANEIIKLPHLQLRGLMGIASNTQDKHIITRQFKLLGSYHHQLRHSGIMVDQLSMGMSNDYTLALENGATMLRIGRKIFGERNK